MADMDKKKKKKLQHYHHHHNQRTTRERKDAKDVSQFPFSHWASQVRDVSAAVCVTARREASRLDHAVGLIAATNAARGRLLRIAAQPFRDAVVRLFHAANDARAWVCRVEKFARGLVAAASAARSAETGGAVAAAAAAADEVEKEALNEEMVGTLTGAVDMGLTSIKILVSSIVVGFVVIAVTAIREVLLLRDNLFSAYFERDLAPLLERGVGDCGLDPWPSIQRQAEEVLRDSQGAIVAIDTEYGERLTLYNDGGGAEDGAEQGPAGATPAANDDDASLSEGFDDDNGDGAETVAVAATAAGYDV